MKSGGPLTRRTPLRARATIERTASPLQRQARRAASRKAKDWSAARAKVAAEGRCRCGCGATEGLQAAHVLGQRYDRDGFVYPDHVIPLARPCHESYDAHRLNIRPLLTADEWEAAVLLVGEGPALRRVMGREWRELA